MSEHRRLSHSAPIIGSVCERIVVFNKRDLVAEWGIEVGHLVVYMASNTIDRLPSVALSQGHVSEIP